MTSLDKLLFEASQGNYPTIDGNANLDEQIDGVTLVKDVDGKIKVSDNFVGNGSGIDLPINITDVTNLQDKLDDTEKYTDDKITLLLNNIGSNFTKNDHKHQISDVDSLQSELDEKVNQVELTNLQQTVDIKADITHLHETSEINGLQTLIDDSIQTKLDEFDIGETAPLAHTHTTTDITDLEEFVNRKVAEASLGGDITLEDASLTVKGITQLSNAIDSVEEDKSATPLAVSTSLTEAKNYTDAEIAELVTASDDKYAESMHKHEISDVNGLEVTLDFKANKLEVDEDITLIEENIDDLTVEVDSLKTNVTTNSTDITAIKSQLANGVASVVHKHEISDTNDLQDELDKKALKTDFNNLKANFDSHVHEISQVNNLQSSLDQKAPLTHVHNWSEIFGRPTTSPAQIDKLADDSHTHPNMNVINNLEDGNGILIYNGNPLGETAYLSVQDITERDAIPMEARKEGLMVLVLEDGGMYYLKGGIDNAFWEIFATGAGGATNASTLPATPSGNLTGLNTQSLIDELETKKADKNDVYSKVETENFIKGYPVDYLTLDNLPDLSTLHGHENKETLELFSQYQGSLTWKGKTIGDLVAERYDANLDGIIDTAQKLEGLNATVDELNYVSGATSNLQAQISAISNGVTFRGEFPTYADMIAGNPTPSKGDLVYIKTDENKDGAIDTQYVYDGTTFVYGGGTTKTPDATTTTKGIIQLGGDLAGTGSSATTPKLTETGVTAGLYKNANLTIDSAGRVTHAEDGNVVFLNDTIVSADEGWSSQKINDELAKKADRTHTHTQLHDADMIGNIRVDSTTPNDNYVITYNQTEGKAKWAEAQGGKTYVGSSFLVGDVKLVGGSYISLGIDPLTNTITINGTYREGGGNVIPTAYEILFSQVVEANSTIRFSTPSTYNKFMLHTLQSYTDKDVTHEVRVYNQAEGGWIEYNSNSEIMISDIVNVPIIDNDNSKMVHVEIQNYGIEDCTVYCRLKCSNLL